jgi:hypothetical protein
VLGVGCLHQQEERHASRGGEGLSCKHVVLCFQISHAGALRESGLRVFKILHAEVNNVVAVRLRGELDLERTDVALVEVTVKILR